MLKTKKTRLVLKFMDMFLSAAIILVTLPIIIVAIPLKLLADGRPLFYVSKRYGKHLIPIDVYKFRTMVNDSTFIQNEIAKLNRRGFEALSLKSRIYTKAGRVFERLQIVELPQMLNVLKGEMSLVGYRPLPKKHIDELIDEFGDELIIRRHDALPGITGISQITGKSKLSNAERIKLEISETKFTNNGNLISVVKIYIVTILVTPFAVFGFGKRTISKIIQTQSC